MATAFTPTHAHHGIHTLEANPTRGDRATKRSALTTFVNDLFEDVRQKPLQAAHLAKHDMFREHINAMSISYFALILLLIGISLPILAYLVHY